MDTYYIMYVMRQINVYPIRYTWRDRRGGIGKMEDEPEY